MPMAVRNEYLKTQEVRRYFKMDCTTRTSTGTHRVRHTQLDDICSSPVQSQDCLLGHFQVGVPSYYEWYKGPSASTVTAFYESENCDRSILSLRTLETEGAC